MFGTANEKYYKNEPVTSRFRYCSKTLDKHIKSIVKLKFIHTYISPHAPLLNKGNIYNTERNVIIGDFNDTLSSDVAYINHYYTKSEEEFLKKIIRGRSDISKKRSVDELIDIHSKNNDEYNSDAWNIYSKHFTI